jgi:uncharacterized membrane protein YadS
MIHLNHIMNENDEEEWPADESIEQTDSDHQAFVNAVVLEFSTLLAAAHDDDDAVTTVIHVTPARGSSCPSSSIVPKSKNKRTMEQQQQQQQQNAADRSATPAMSSDDSDDDKMQAQHTRSKRHHCRSFCCCCHRHDDDDDDDDDENVVVPPPLPRRVQELYTSADWWSLWIGLATFLMGIVVVFAVPYEQGSDRVPYVIPQPMKWTTNPLDAWDVYNIVGTILLLLAFCGMYLVSLQFMGKLRIVVAPVRHQSDDSGVQGGGDRCATPARSYISGFATMATLATLSVWIGSNEWCDEHGLGYAVWAILLGMLVTNGAPLVVGGGGANDTNNNNNRVDETLSHAAKDGEFFIKCSLVLLAVQLDVLVQVGVPGIAVAWIGSPLAIIMGYVIGTRCFHCKDSLALLISVGAAWCGASAISAVAPIVSAKSEDVSLAISVVAFFTLAFTFIQPYFAMGVGMNESVAGAWIGASVDQTGNVIVSAAIISEKATEVAAIIKMVLNSGLGIMASVIACWWNSRTVEGEEKKPFSLIMLCK